MVSRKFAMSRLYNSSKSNSTRVARSTGRDSGYASSGGQRNYASRTKSLNRNKGGRPFEEDRQEEYDPDKPTVIRHKKVDEPIVRQWVSTLRGEMYDDNKPDFVVDAGDASKARKDRLSYKEELELRTLKREEEKQLQASWQGSLRGGLDESSWVTIENNNQQKRARNNRAGSEKRYSDSTYRR